MSETTPEKPLPLVGATIRHVAAAANVSQTTVSNYLNGRQTRMRPTTRQRIEVAIRDLGYQRNMAARQLRTGRAQTIGLIVPSVANPFWGGIVQAVEKQALREDRRVLLCNSGRDAVTESAYLNDLWASGVRAVIIATSLPQVEHLIPAVERGMRVIMIDREAQPADPAGLVTISTDNYTGTLLATKHLIELGHRRIGFISGRMATVCRRQRLRGYRAALNDTGIDYADELVWVDSDHAGYGDIDGPERGVEGASALLGLQDPPTAMVTLNDMYAIGACAAVRRRGLRVPYDVSVVGFDDAFVATLVDPPLTTIAQPVDRIAKAALRVITSDRVGPDVRFVGPMLPSLIVRDSTAPPAGL